MPVRQWVLSFPILLRVLFAAHPELLTPVLRIVHRVIVRFLLKQAGNCSRWHGYAKRSGERVNVALVRVALGWQ